MTGWMSTPLACERPLRFTLQFFRAFPAHSYTCWTPVSLDHRILGKAGGAFLPEDRGPLPGALAAGRNPCAPTPSDFYPANSYPANSYPANSGPRPAGACWSWPRWSTPTRSARTRRRSTARSPWACAPRGCRRCAEVAPRRGAGGSTAPWQGRAGQSRAKRLGKWQRPAAAAAALPACGVRPPRLPASPRGLWSRPRNSAGRVAAAWVC